jgi:hypothetical protein
VGVSPSQTPEKGSNVCSPSCCLASRQTLIARLAGISVVEFGASEKDHGDKKNFDKNEIYQKMIFKKRKRE